MSTPETRARPPLRAAVVGCGRMGEKHLRVLAATAGVDLVALCDVSADRLAAASRSLAPDAACFTAHGAMYEHAALDLVVVATPPTRRAAPAIEALDRRIAVLAEKPPAATLRDADRMVDAAARAGATLAVHHQYRVSAALRRCRSLIDDGLIGDVVLLRGLGKGGRRGGVELLEIGTHLADIMIVLAGRPAWCSAAAVEGRRLAGARDVRPSADVAPEEPDLGNVLGARVLASYGFAGGAIGEMHFLGYEQRMPANYGVDVLGTKGRLALRCSRHVDSPLWHLPRPMEGAPGGLGDWRVVRVPGGGNRGLVEAFHVELLRALRDGDLPPCTGLDGAAALEMVLAAYHSHRDGGRRVELPLAAREDPLATWTPE